MSERAKDWFALGKAVKNFQKHAKRYVFFERITLKDERITDVALLKRNREWFAHHRSFVKSDESNSLTATLFKERFAHSRSFLKSVESKQIAHSCSLNWAILNKRAKSEKANEQIPYPVFWTIFMLDVAKSSFKGLSQVKLKYCKIKYCKYWMATHSICSTFTVLYIQYICTVLHIEVYGFMLYILMRAFWAGAGAGVKFL